MGESITTRFDARWPDALRTPAVPVPPDANYPLPGPGLDARLMPGVASGGRHAWLRRRGDEHFLELLSAYRATGGLARDNEVVRRCGDHGGRCLEQFMRARAEGRLIRFEWSGLEWLPLFQFDADMRLDTQVQSVINELVPVFDGWELAQWFAQPNGWLDLLRPLDLVVSALPRVIDAARADRFIAAG